MKNVILSSNAGAVLEAADPWAGFFCEAPYLPSHCMLIPCSRQSFLSLFDEIYLL